MVRIAAFGIGSIAILLAIPAQRLNIAFLVALAFAVAASANLPALLYNLFWRRFNTVGATFSIYGGLICAVVLVLFSPVVSGTPTSLAPNADFAWFPLRNPGIVSIPFGFLCGIHRHLDQQGRPQSGPLQRARGAVADRGRCGEGDQPLNLAAGA